uniref:Uncharacterized protein n=1 Tax=Arundo donax TaxID=35708 RepID=A0A0A9BA86_ARUDO
MTILQLSIWFGATLYRATS